MRSSDSHAASFTCMTQGPDLAAQHAAVIACSGAGVPVCDLYKNVETHDDQPHVTMLFSGWYLSTEKMLIQDIDEAAAARWRPTRPMHAVTSSCPRSRSSVPCSRRYLLFKCSTTSTSCGFPRLSSSCVQGLRPLPEAARPTLRCS